MQRSYRNRLTINSMTVIQRGFQERRAAVHALRYMFANLDAGSVPASHVSAEYATSCVTSPCHLVIEHYERIANPTWQQRLRRQDQETVHRSGDLCLFQR